MSLKPPGQGGPLARAGSHRHKQSRWLLQRMFSSSPENWALPPLSKTTLAGSHRKCKTRCTGSGPEGRRRRGRGPADTPTSRARLAGSQIPRPLWDIPSPSATPRSAAGRRYSLEREPLPRASGQHTWAAPEGASAAFVQKRKSAATRLHLVRAQRELAQGCTSWCPHPTMLPQTETHSKTRRLKTAGMRGPRSSGLQGHFHDRLAEASLKSGFQHRCFALTAY